MVPRRQQIRSKNPVPPIGRVRWDEADEDIRVEVPTDQSCSGQVGSEPSLAGVAATCGV